MRLPSLSVIIASQAIIWCAAGAWILGPKILLYPLAWVAVGAAFYFHLKKYPIGATTAKRTKRAAASEQRATGIENEKVSAT